MSERRGSVSIGNGLLRTLVTLAAALLTPLVCCASAATSAFVTIPPQAYFVEHVGGDHVHVDVLVGPGQSPHAFEPTPKQMARLVESDVYFTIGLPFERELVRRIRDIAPELIVVATDYPVPKRPMDEAHRDRDEAHDAAGGEHGEAHDGAAGHHGEAHDGVAGHHGEAHDGAAGHHGEADDGAGGDHHEDTAGLKDPHVWLDPDLVKIQADVIARTLKRLDPGNAETYDANLERFSAELDSLDEAISDALAPLEGSRLYVFHPSFGYFAEAYGLVQVPVETAGREPGGRQLAELIEKARTDGARVIFVQPQFSTDAAEAVADAIDGAVVPIDPLARDYASNLRRVAREIRDGLEGGGR
ncbi:MAG: ABC transporter substrate-binding protein [Candidatus Eisenbacteria bacterium]|nr:ABC transporter substrate-binding protein [Candidatus Eisenbacteria bacterium]